MEQIGLSAQAQGWDCWAVHGPRMTNPSQLKTIQANSLFDEKVHGLLYSLLLNKHGLGSKAATKRLVAYLDEVVKPDIIHLHNLHGYYINYEVLFEYLKRTQIPIVWTLHDFWNFTGHCAHFINVGCEKWKTECHKCPQVQSYPKSLFIDNCQSNFRKKKNSFTSVLDNITLVPVSQWLANYVKGSFLGDAKMRVIYNGISIERFKPISEPERIAFKEKYHLTGKKLLLGVAAPWTPTKGLNDFIQLRKELNEEYAIAVVGVSSQQLKELPDGMIGIERTQNVQELVDFYSCADVLLNTTYADNYPTVNLEAIACGTPVITYDTGGSPESITPETGIVVPQGDIEALKSAINEVLSKDREALRMVCRTYAEAHFEDKKCFSEYLELYEQILSSK